MPEIFVSIVTYQTEGPLLEKCLEALLASTFPVHISVIDNASINPPSKTLSRLQEKITLTENQTNLGFCGGHNQAVFNFLRGTASYFLILNPDLCVAPTLLSELVAAFEKNQKVGLATPLLFRADENLQPLSPPVIDASGMIFTSSFRHLDRGSGELDRGTYNKQEEVFGGTGACLLLSRAFILSALLSGLQHESDVDALYPQLKAGRSQRALLFDEGFFAYREDAELALRARTLGWKCLYVPTAVGYHVRKVVPERRSELPKELNLLGVRNRFLLQLNHLPPLPSFATFLNGLIFRNLVVILVVLLKEHSSLRAFSDLARLTTRARERNRALRKIAKNFLLQ